MWTSLFGILVIVAISGVLSIESDENMIRKSIVYDKKTPDVFYCPQEKPNGLDNTLVKSRPLAKLCEYGGKGTLPEGYKSDCYGDVDETQFACKEKRRIMKRRYPPGMEALAKYMPQPRWKRAEMYALHHGQTIINKNNYYQHDSFY